MTGPGFALPNAPGDVRGFQALPQWITQGLARSPYARALGGDIGALLGAQGIPGFRDDQDAAMFGATGDQDALLRRGLGARAATGTTGTGTLPPWAQGTF